MTKNPRFLALVIAVFVNLAALATVHTAMGEITQREQAAQFIPDRIVVATHRMGAYQFAARTCAAPSTL
ncbi:MAG: hypothetical protein D4S02_05825 [Rhodocyclaceae bacterium]|nr:MAG: hypothetical protein D4S02_05825 [Rhodocyclaceae bacterium]